MALLLSSLSSIVIVVTLSSLLSRCRRCCRCRCFQVIVVSASDVVPTEAPGASVDCDPYCVLEVLPEGSRSKQGAAENTKYKTVCKVNRSRAASACGCPRVPLSGLLYDTNEVIFVVFSCFRRLHASNIRARPVPGGRSWSVLCLLFPNRYQPAPPRVPSCDRLFLFVSSRNGANITE